MALPTLQPIPLKLAPMGAPLLGAYLRRPETACYFAWGCFRYFFWHAESQILVPFFARNTLYILPSPQEGRFAIATDAV